MVIENPILNLAHCIVARYQILLCSLLNVEFILTGASPLSVFPEHGIVDPCEERPEAPVARLLRAVQLLEYTQLRLLNILADEYNNKLDKEYRCRAGRRRLFWTEAETKPRFGFTNLTHLSPFFYTRSRSRNRIRPWKLRFQELVKK